MSGERTVALFLEMMSAERAHRKHSSAYARDLEQYIGFLKRRGCALGAADSDEVRAWLSELQTEGLAKSTIARRLSAARQLHKFAYAEGIVDDDPAGGIAAPRKARTLPKTMSVRQAELLIAAREQARARVARRG